MSPCMPRSKKSTNNVMLSANLGERSNAPPQSKKDERSFMVPFLGLRRWMHKSCA